MGDRDQTENVFKFDSRLLGDDEDQFFYFSISFLLSFIGGMKGSRQDKTVLGLEGNEEMFLASVCVVCIQWVAKRKGET